MAYYRFDKDKQIWNKIDPKDKVDSDIKLEEKLIPVLEAAKKDCIFKDLDFVMIIFGGVGTGKSTLGRLCCRYFSNERFNPREHMVRDAADIKRVMNNAKKNDAIVFDEASGIFASTDVMTKKTKYAQLVLDVCRQKNLLIIIIAPQMNRLSASIAIDRTKIALRTFLHRKTRRKGKFAFYGTRLKSELYELSKKKHGKIDMVRPKWHGEFGKDITGEEEYRRVKDETLNMVLDSFGTKKEKEEEKRKTPAQIESDFIKSLIVYHKNKTSTEIAKIINIHPASVRRIRKKIKDDLKNEKFLKNGNP